MSRGDLVIVGEDYPSAGDTGVIIEMSKGYANVYWASGKTYWIEIQWLELLQHVSER
jgi:hypothetical protein